MLAIDDTGGSPLGGSSPDSPATAAIAEPATRNGRAVDGDGQDTQVCSQDQIAPRVTILICSDCRHLDGSDARPRPGELLARATCEAALLANIPDSISIQTVACLGNCKRRLSASLVTSGCWSYVFGDLAIENAGDLIDVAKLMQGSEDGLMPWRGRPQCMKKGLVARIPPIAPDPLSTPKKSNSKQET